MGDVDPSRALALLPPPLAPGASTFLRRAENGPSSARAREPPKGRFARHDRPGSPPLPENGTRLLDNVQIRRDRLKTASSEAVNQGARDLAPGFGGGSMGSSTVIRKAVLGVVAEQCDDGHAVDGEGCARNVAAGKAELDVEECLADLDCEIPSDKLALVPGGRVRALQGAERGRRTRTPRSPARVRSRFLHGFRSAAAGRHRVSRWLSEAP